MWIPMTLYLHFSLTSESLKSEGRLEKVTGSVCPFFWHGFLDQVSPPRRHTHFIQLSWAFYWLLEYRWLNLASCGIGYETKFGNNISATKRYQNICRKLLASLSLYSRRSPMPRHRIPCLSALPVAVASVNGENVKCLHASEHQQHVSANYCCCKGTQF